MSARSMDFSRCFLLSAFCFLLSAFGALGGFFCGLRGERLPGGGVTFFSGKKESHQRKLPRERERVRAERSDGPSLRWALGSLIGSQSPMPMACWCYRSFANSFTLCLICFACAARVAVGYATFLCSLPAVCGLAARRQWNNDCPCHCSLSALFALSKEKRARNCQQYLKHKKTIKQSVKLLANER